MPLLIGLTGGIGSGKSAVANRLVQKGAGLVDTDAIAHALTGPEGAAMPDIAAVFGAELISPDGALNRAAMRGLIFKDPAQKTLLENILHPRIRAIAKARQQALEDHVPYVLLAVPLLTEIGPNAYPCDRILLVDCPENEQIRRVMARSQLTRSDVEAIMAQQASRAERRAIADDILLNDSTLSALEAAIDTLHTRYLTLATRPR